jgi:serine protease
MQENGKRKRTNLFWLLVLAAVVLVWWFFRPEGAHHGLLRGATQQEIETDRVAASADADPDDILVDLDDHATDAQVAALERDLDIQLVLVSDQSADERFYRAHVDPARRDALIAELSVRPEVELAEADATISLAPGEETAVAPAGDEWEGFPNDPKYKFQWHMDQIHMPQAWKMADGHGVIVAVLDTGVAYDNWKNQHKVPDLDGVEFVKPYNFVGNNQHAGDDHGHGTHVTGTIAQVTNNGIGVTGIARKVKIMPLKVLSAGGSGSIGGIADAIHYAADEGAKVINMSLGGRFPSKALEKAVKYAHDKGVTVVCAAGNDGRNKVGYPAAYPGAIAVAATQFDESTTFYSNYGKDIDVAAPGGNTKVDQNGDGMPDGVLQNTIAIQDPTHDDYYGYMGTSMASPHAAGVAALIVGQGVTDPDQVEAILESTARAPRTGKMDKARYGAGIIDAQAAITKANRMMAHAQLTRRNQESGFGLMFGVLISAAVAFGLRRRGSLGIGLGAGYLAGAALGAVALAWLPANALLLSAALPLVLVGVLYGVPRARGLVAGIAAGVAGHLLFRAITPMHQVSWMVFDQAWLVANALVCAFLARAVLRK